jgi:hypothetical protein
MDLQRHKKGQGEITTRKRDNNSVSFEKKNAPKGIFNI